MPSTVQLYNQTITDFKRLQSSLYEGQSKIGADSKASTFAELGSDLTVAQSFTYSAQRAQRFANSIEEVGRKQDSAYRSVDEIVNAVIDFKANLTLENSGSSNINDLAGAANTALDLIRGALNARDGSTYLFGGSKTNEQPVNDLTGQSNYINGQATANYYNGDDFISAVDVSKSLRVDYGVTAANPAFKGAIAAINLAKSSESSGNLQQAGQLLDSAIDSLIALRAKMGNDSKIFQTTLETQKSAQTTFEQKFAEINEPDIVQLTLETGQAQTALTALFQNFARISSLSLKDYL